MKLALCRVATSLLSMMRWSRRNHPIYRGAFCQDIIRTEELAAFLGAQRLVVLFELGRLPLPIRMVAFLQLFFPTGRAHLALVAIAPFPKRGFEDAIG